MTVLVTVFGTAVGILGLIAVWLLVRVNRLEQERSGSSHLEEKALSDLERRLTRKLKRMEQLIERARKLDLSKAKESESSAPEEAPVQENGASTNGRAQGNGKKIEDSVPDFDPRERYERLRSETHRQIALQLDLGREKSEVAREFDVGVGEVELVENLMEL